MAQQTGLLKKLPVSLCKNECASREVAPGERLLAELDE